MRNIKRGGEKDLEIKHADLLLGQDIERVWGWDSPAGRVRVRRRSDWFVKTLEVKKSDRLLECGCGTGVFTREMAKTGAHIVALDVSRKLLDYARQHLALTNVNFREADIEDEKTMPAESFDAAYGVSILHHVDMNRTLPILKKHLKPGGKFAFSEPNLSNPINKYQFADNPDRRQKIGLSPNEMAFYYSELRDEFVKHGFHVDFIAYRDFMHPSIPPTAIPVFQVLEMLLESFPFVNRFSGSLWIHGTLLR